MMLNSILEINQGIKVCSFCRLSQSRQNAVCGEGIIPSKIMFIAQAPGRIEDEKDHILIGPSGKVFNQLLDEMNINRQNVYITNLIKCFLPKCRKPRSDELNTCYELYLKNEIELVKPDIIVCMGYHVSKFMFKKFDLKVPTRIGFRTVFGKLFVSKNKKLVPVRHPATVVHESKQFSKLINDYSILKTLQLSCKLVNTCQHYEAYTRGMVSINYIEKFCFGDWTVCKYYH